MTDSHAHLTFSEISNNIEKVLEEFIESGGKHILNVGHTPQTNIEVIAQYSKLQEKYENIIINSVGIHPEYITDMLSTDIDRYKQIGKTIKELEELVNKNIKTIWAIGECGLDYYHIKRDISLTKEDLLENISQQKHLFASQISMAKELKLPLTIHTRDLEGDNDCMEDALQLISQEGKGSVTGSFHSYTQNPIYISEILGLGFSIGVNGIATYPKAENIREIVRRIPLEKMLLETDSPLLPPQKVRKNKKFWRNYGAPGDIEEIGQTVSEVKGVTYQEVINQTTQNFKSLFFIN